MELAVFTGKPHFAEPQHVGGPIVEPETRRRFHELADTAFDANVLTNAGPLSRRLEEETAALHRTAEAVFLSNATLAQMLLMRALGLTSGEVLTASNTFVAAPHVCEWLGIRPVFCDIDPVTLNLDPAAAERLVTPETRAVIPTHIFGVLADMEALAALAGRHGAVLLADAAHAFGCTRGDVFPGGFGAPEFLSFHATKFFSTFEGGAVLTNDSALAEELRAMRNFGFTRPGDAGILGLNAKAPEISAAFGLASLPALAERRERLLAVREVYIRKLAGVPGIRVHDIDSAGRNNYRYFTVFAEEAFGLTRDELAAALAQENILVRSYFSPGCHRMGYYRSRRPQTPALPVTERLLGQILSLPTSFPGREAEKAAAETAHIIRVLHDRRLAVRDRLRKDGA